MKITDKNFRYCITHPILPISAPQTKQIWMTQPKPHKQVQRSREFALIKEISFTDPPNSYSIKLGLHIYYTLSQLCKRKPIKLQIPETVIFGYGFETPTLFYTDFQGYLRIIQRMNPLQLEILYHIFEYHRQSYNRNYSTPLAIMKFSSSIHDRVIMKAEELLNELKSSFKVETLIQRYIVPKGNKACKFRAVLRPNNPLRFYSITNKQRLDCKVSSQPQTLPVLPEPQDAAKIDMRSSTIFTSIHEGAQKYLKHNKTEAELLNLGQKFEQEKNFVGDLVELNYSDIKTVQIDNRKLKKLKTAPKIPSVVVDDEVKRVKPRDELANYLKEVFSNYKPQESLVQLHKKLVSLGQVNSHEESNKEDITLSNNITNGLRNLFCTEAVNPKKSTIFHVTSTTGFRSIENMVKTLKKKLDTHIFFKDRQEIVGIVCDFTQDAFQNCFFDKIKHFTVRKLPEFNRSLTSSSEEELKCPGKYCYQESDLSINELEQSIRVLNKASVYKVLRKTIFEEEITDYQKLISPFYHQTVDVCANCFAIYMKKEREKIKLSMKKPETQKFAVEEHRFARPIRTLKSLSKGFSSINLSQVNSRTNSVFFPNYHH